ncbi:hypothetical protein [Acidovorax sp.]|uniref:hypothetical protein n=1 Tax=Acidovorax sp. TaxID=1872122 RepID=UPI00391FB29C
MKPRLAFLLGALGALLASPVLAQSVYKCGNTFSQTPCAADAKKIEVKPAVGVDCSGYTHMLSEACLGKPSSGTASIDEARAKVQKQIDAMPPAVPPSNEAIEANKQRCLTRIMTMLKDPESARVGAVARAKGPSPDYETAKGWFPSVSYTVSVNAKNSFGGYTGSKLWICSFDVAEQELLRARAIE